MGVVLRLALVECIRDVVVGADDDVVAVAVAVKADVFVVVVGVNMIVLGGLNPSDSGAAVTRNAAKQQTIVRLVDEIR